MSNETKPSDVEMEENVDTSPNHKLESLIGKKRSLEAIETKDDDISTKRLKKGKPKDVVVNNGNMHEAAIDNRVQYVGQRDTKYATLSHGSTTGTSSISFPAKSTARDRDGVSSYPMSSSEISDAMNGSQKKNISATTFQSQTESPKASLHSIQAKLNTQFQRSRTAVVRQEDKRHTNALPDVDKDPQCTEETKYIQDAKSSTSAIHYPRFKVTSEASPSTPVLYFAMAAMFLLNVSTTYLILALYFATNTGDGLTDQNLSLMFQLVPTIVSNIIATVGLSYIIRPEHTTYTERHHPHVIPPSSGDEKLSDMTLRQFLIHPDGFHLGLAPAFFGFYVYFGALTALHENVLSDEDKKEGKLLLPVGLHKKENRHDEQEILLKSVAGASAGAMAAVLLASGLDPRESAEFASSMTFERFNDFPGFGGVLKGDLFEEIMVKKLKESRANVDEDESESERNHDAVDNLKLEDGLVPVAVTAFDVMGQEGKILKSGCMGKASRASATFPGLFQPCKWHDSGSKFYLMDGGLKDPHGLVGLKDLGRQGEKKRIVNLCAGNYWPSPVGPSQLPKGLNATEMVSISIENSPQCGPWAMDNGPRAVEASMHALNEVLDVPMYKGAEESHFILRVDAKAFIPKK